MLQYTWCMCSNIVQYERLHAKTDYGCMEQWSGKNLKDIIGLTINPMLYLPEEKTQLSWFCMLWNCCVKHVLSQTNCSTWTILRQQKLWRTPQLDMVHCPRTRCRQYLYGLCLTFCQIWCTDIWCTDIIYTVTEFSACINNYIHTNYGV